MPIAVVTGAARGIGAAIAERLEADGYEVLRLDLEGGYDETTGTPVIECDVSDHAAVHRLAEEVGPVDALVNNAGIWLFSSLEQTDPERFNRVLAVNVGGTFNCTQAFGSGMLDRGGSIVNIVSIAAAAASPGVGAYSPSKSAVLALTRQTAMEWGPRGVRVNAVGPGMVPTPGSHEVYHDERVREIRADAVPLRRLGDPVDIANVVGFLTGPDAAYVTGQVIYVDGGISQSLMTLIPRPPELPGPHLD